MSVFDYLRNFGSVPTAPAPSDSRFLTLTEASAAMVLIVEDDVIRYANKAARSGEGAKRSDLVGSHFSDLAQEGSREGLRQRMTGATPSNVLAL